MSRLLFLILASSAILQKCKYSLNHRIIINRFDYSSTNSCVFCRIYALTMITVTMISLYSEYKKQISLPIPKTSHLRMLTTSKFINALIRKTTIRKNIILFSGWLITFVVKESIPRYILPCVSLIKSIQALNQFFHFQLFQQTNTICLRIKIPCSNSSILIFLSDILHHVQIPPLKHTLHKMPGAYGRTHLTVFISTRNVYNGIFIAFM